MRLFIDFINALHEVELMKIAVHDHMREQRGGDKVIRSSELIHYIPSVPEDGLMYFRMDYMNHSQSPTTLANVARAKFTNQGINLLINTGKLES